MTPQLVFDKKRFIDLAESFPGIFYMCRSDENNSFSYISGRCEEMLGYYREKFTSGAVTLKSIIHPDDYAGMVEVLRFCARRRRTYYLNYKIRAASGEWLAFESYGSILYEDGAIAGYAGVMYDESQRIEMAKRVRESEEQYRELVENIQDIVYRIDNAGLICYVNGAVRTILGYEPSQLIGKRLDAYIIRRENLQKILSGRDALGQSDARLLKLVSKSGTTKILRSMTKTLRRSDGCVIGYQGIACDVTWEYERDRIMLDLVMQKLSKREREVLWRMAIGMYYREIARDLCIHEQSVYTYLRRVRKKLKLEDLVPLFEQICRIEDAFN